MTREDGKPEIEFFYADPLGAITFIGPLKTPWGDVQPIKVDQSELCLDGDNVIRVRAEDFPTEDTERER